MYSCYTSVDEQKGEENYKLMNQLSTMIIGVLLSRRSYFHESTEHHDYWVNVFQVEHKETTKQAYVKSNL